MDIRHSLRYAPHDRRNAARFEKFLEGYAAGGVTLSYRTIDGVVEVDVTCDGSSVRQFYGDVHEEINSYDNGMDMVRRT